MAQAGVPFAELVTIALRACLAVHVSLVVGSLVDRRLINHCSVEYGECGVGAYCLGGCDPQYSNTLDSCVPAPVCKTEDYKLTSLDGITANTEYLGDATKANWVSSGTPLQGPDKDSVILTLSEDGQSQSGTLLASSHYVWYGKISATMKSSRGAGVVSAFILLSDVKDEIDFEFVGADLQNTQSNFYFQGITDCEWSTYKFGLGERRN